MQTVLLLIASNCFMTAAWYGHLRWPHAPLWIAVTASWGIAFFEYWLAVPANRIGYLSGFTPAQLKIIQEVVSLTVFALLAWAWLGERPGWRHLGAFACLIGAVAFLFAGRKAG